MDAQTLRLAAQNALEQIDPETGKALVTLAVQVAQDLPIPPPTTDETITLRTTNGDIVLGYVFTKKVTDGWLTA